MNKNILLLALIVLAFVLSGCASTTKEVIQEARAPKETYSIKAPGENYCEHKGAVSRTVYNIYGDRAEICQFEDGSQCLQWDYFMRDCMPGDNPPLKVDIFLPNPDLDPENLDCGRVYPYEITVGQYENWERLTLNKLLEAPIEEQAKLGYTSLISSEAELNSFKFKDNIITLDFDKKIKGDIDDDCQKKIFKKQFDRTLTQFGSTDKVEITIDEEETDFYLIKDESQD